MITGIVSYGTYIPSLRVRVSEIASFWERDGETVSKALGLEEKSAPAIDEDSVTMAVESAFYALESGKVDKQLIQAILVGSESHPYSVNPTSTTVGEILGIPSNYLAADTEFACKAGTAAMELILGLVEAGKIELGLAIGTDTAQAKPGDALEYTAASASAAFILGSKNVIAKVIDFNSFSSNTPDFWRRDGQKYPSHGGRFTGEPGYFAHIIGASSGLLSKSKMKPEDFDFAVFHMPNGKFPREVAKKLGFSSEQIAAGLVVDKMGNSYAASTLVGLAAVLDNAKPGQKIFVCSYGSGAGSDAFILETTQAIKNFNQVKTVSQQLEQKRVIPYPAFVKIFKSKEFI